MRACERGCLLRHAPCSPCASPTGMVCGAPGLGSEKLPIMIKHANEEPNVKTPPPVPSTFYHHDSAPIVPFASTTTTTISLIPTSTPPPPPPCTTLTTPPPPTTATPSSQHGPECRPRGLHLGHRRVLPGTPLRPAAVVHRHLPHANHVQRKSHHACRHARAAAHCVTGHRGGGRWR